MKGENEAFTNAAYFMMSNRQARRPKRCGGQKDRSQAASQR